MAEGISVPQGTRVSADADGPLVGAARSVESAARRASDKVHEAKEKLIEAKDRIAQKSVSELVDDGRSFVRENPGTTILVSVGVGALIGYLVGRRRS